MPERTTTARQSLPRGALLSALLLVGFAVVATAIGGRDRPSGSKAELAGLTSVAEASRLFTFADREDGAVLVTDTLDGRTFVLERGSHNFVRGVMRGLNRERRRRGLDAGLPFRLTRWSAAQASLEDPATGRRIELAAFGPTNLQEFVALLPGSQRAMTSQIELTQGGSDGTRPGRGSQ